LPLFAPCQLYQRVVITASYILKGNPVKEPVPDPVEVKLILLVSLRESCFVGYKAMVV
jgi:hypothetical protein